MGTKNQALTFLEHDIMCLEAQERFGLKTSHLDCGITSVDEFQHTRHRLEPHAKRKSGTENNKESTH
jgi:hypothetical protein